MTGYDPPGQATPLDASCLGGVRTETSSLIDGNSEESEEEEEYVGKISPSLTASEML
jgi:hypothetical protein